MNEDGVRVTEEPSVTVRFLVWVTVDVGAVSRGGGCRRKCTSGQGLVGGAFAFGCVGFTKLVEQLRRPSRTLGVRRAPSSLELALDSLGVCGD